jgi:hypothetical protein
MPYWALKHAGSLENIATSVYITSEENSERSAVPKKQFTCAYDCLAIQAASSVRYHSVTQLVVRGVTAEFRKEQLDDRSPERTSRPTNWQNVEFLLKQVVRCS